MRETRDLIVGKVVLALNIKSYFGARWDFSKSLSKALKRGSFDEKDKLMLRAQPKTVTRELMAQYGVAAWPEDLQRKVEVCEKLLLKGVAGDNPQLAAIAYACLRALVKAAAQKSGGELVEAEPA